MNIKIQGSNNFGQPEGSLIERMTGNKLMKSLAKRLTDAGKTLEEHLTKTGSGMLIDCLSPKTTGENVSGRSEKESLTFLMKMTTMKNKMTRNATTLHLLGPTKEPYHLAASLSTYNEQTQLLKTYRRMQKESNGHSLSACLGLNSPKPNGLTFSLDKLLTLITFSPAFTLMCMMTDGRKSLETSRSLSDG